MKETKETKESQNKKIEEKMIQQHLADAENTHTSAVSDPVWGFLLKIYQRYATKPGGLEDARPLFKKYLEGKSETKYNPLKDAYSHLTTIFDQPMNSFDRVPEHLIAKLDPKLRPPVTTLNGKTETYISLIDVFSLIYHATMDQACFPESSSTENRLLTLCNALKILHQRKPGICHTGTRNDLVHTLNVVYTLPGALTPVVFLDDIDTALLGWIKQQARNFLNILREWLNVISYHKPMLEWVKTGETPGEIIKLFNAPHPQKTETTIIRNYIEQQLEAFDLNPIDYKNKLDNFLNSEALKYLQMPLEPGELYYVVNDIFNQPETIGDSVRDQALSQFKLEVEARLVSGQITAGTEPQFIQELQQFLQVDKAFVFYQKYRSVFITQTDFDVSFLEKTCKDFYQKTQAQSPSNLESKRESKAQEAELPLEKLQVFVTEANRFLQDSHVSWIENFFTVYRLAPDIETKQKLYAKWYTLCELGKVVALDEWLKVIYQKSEQSEGSRIVHISPYEVNRIVSHAIHTSPKKWTALFTETYALVLEQLEGNEFDGFLTRQFRDNAYPEDLRTQLRFIKVLRNPHISVAEAKSTQASESLQYPDEEEEENEIIFPMAYWIDSQHALESLFDVSYQLAPDQHARLIEELDTKQLQNINKSAYFLGTVLYHLNPEQHGNLLTKLGAEHLRGICKNDAILISMLERLDMEIRQHLLRKLDAGHLKTIIKDAYTLSRVLGLLDAEPGKNLMTMLGEHLKTRIIRDFHQLTAALNTNRENTDHGINLLAAISSEHFQLILEDGHQLGSVLESISTQQCQNLLRAIAANQLLRIIIQDHYQLVRVFKCLDDAEQARNFLAEIGFEKVRSLFQDDEHITDVFSGLDSNQKDNLLATIEDELHILIKEGLQLIALLDCLNIQQGQKILRAIGGEQLQKILTNAPGLAFFLGRYPGLQTNFLKILDQRLKTIIREGFFLARILENLHEEYHIVLLRMLDREQFQDSCKDKQDLWSVFSYLNPKQRDFFLPAYKKHVISILSDEYAFKFGHWRSHSARMDALKREINRRDSIKDIYNLLSRELEAYRSQADSANKNPPVHSLIPKFNVFKKEDLLQNEQQSRYYRAVESAKDLNHGKAMLGEDPSATPRSEAKREIETPREMVSNRAIDARPEISYVIDRSFIRDEKKDHQEESRPSSILVFAALPDVSSSSAIHGFFCRSEIRPASSTSSDHSNSSVPDTFSN